MHPTPPLFKENVQKEGPMLREFWAQLSTQMGAKYPHSQYVMHCPSWVLLIKTSREKMSNQNKVNKEFIKDGCPNTIRPTLSLVRRLIRASLVGCEFHFHSSLLTGFLE